MIKIMRKLLAIVFVFVSLYSNSQSMCGGSSATLLTVNPQNLANPSYSMNPGGVSPITPTSGPSTPYYVVSPNSTASFTLYTTGQNTSNVNVTTSVVITVTVNAQPNASPTLTQASCTNSLNNVNLGLTFNPGIPAPAYTISWTPLPASVLSPQQTTASALTPGPYSLVVTAAGGCTTVINFTMNPQPAPAIFSVNPFGGTHSITCIQPTVVLNATNPNLTYTWSSTSSTPVAASSVTLDATNLGTLNVVGQNTVSGCTTTYTFLIAQNVAVPSSSISATTLSISCTQTAAPTISVTSNPTVNISHYIYSPQGGTFSAQSYTAIYSIGGPGTYTHDLIDNASGCFTRKTFTVTSSTGYPTYTVTSPQSFTLGCTTKSVATINIVNANTTPQGGSLTYTIIGPPTSTVIPFTSSLSTQSTYTVNVPGTWTVIAKDFVNFCETRTPISVIQNTFVPNISAIVPRQILNCDFPSTVLEGVSETTGVSYNWGFAGVPGNVPGATITVNTLPANTTQTLVNNYTLTITDNNNTCKTSSLIPIYQNIFPPKTSMSNGGIGLLTCGVSTIQLSNNSSTGILGNFFPTNLPVIGYLWQGPSPQEPLQVNSTYLAATVGDYTLTGKDLNNGCLSSTVLTIGDNRIVPTLNNPIAPEVAILDCGNQTKITPNITNTGTSLLTFTWLPPSNQASLSGQFTRTLTTNFPGIYTVTVRNSDNACVSSTTMQIKTGTLAASFDNDPVTGFAPLVVTFTNTSISEAGSTSGITSIWSFGNGTNTSTPDATITATTVYKLPGTYQVVMFAQKGTCLDSTMKYIKVELPSELTVPNVFTPNGDNVNDFFNLKATNLTELTLQIFDRWGHLVYDLTTDKGNIDWDGKNQYGKECAEGTYFYIIKATGKDGVSYDKNGTVSLFR